MSIFLQCSAGVGRTGTFICIDNVLTQIKKEQVVDIAGAINRMRHQRMKMVQTVVSTKTQCKLHNMNVLFNRFRINLTSCMLLCWSQWHVEIRRSILATWGSAWGRWRKSTLRTIWPLLSPSSRYLCQQVCAISPDGTVVMLVVYSSDIMWILGVGTSVS